MRCSTLALLLATAATGALANNKGAGTPASCAAILKYPNSAQFTESKGGYINLRLQNPGTTTLQNVEITYSLLPTVADPTNYPNGGAFAQTTKTRGMRHRASNSRNAPPAVISNGGRTVTYTIASLAPGEKMKLGVNLMFETGVARSGQIEPTLSINGVPCTPAKKMTVVMRVTPEATLTSGKQIYQQYASVYRLCLNNINATAESDPAVCAAACNANTKCTAFVMGPLSANDNTPYCRLYRGKAGGGNAPPNQPAPGLMYTQALGYTIYLQRKKPYPLIGTTVAGTCPYI